jgi:aconitase A
MLEFEAMQVPWAKTEVSAQYIDHNLLQTDFKNADDHLFLLSACKKFGVWYSRPGNGGSHVLCSRGEQLGKVADGRCIPRWHAKSAAAAGGQ